LTVLSVCIASTTVITGVFSINVGKIPRNELPGQPDQPGGRFTVFGAVVVTATVAAASVIAVTRWWWVEAGKKFKKRKTESVF
jgi:Mg2+ and Co2+ transporter CorA